mmetsp:Transcript_11185/g.31118  ORF Transcript_11185/g.31118 Transcript_11185/m.31118 type:complete len:112 (+) Transcript_11185:251-586(+)
MVRSGLLLRCPFEFANGLVRHQSSLTMFGGGNRRKKKYYTPLHTIQNRYQVWHDRDARIRFQVHNRENKKNQNSMKSRSSASREATTEPTHVLSKSTRKYSECLVPASGLR